MYGTYAPLPISDRYIDRCIRDYHYITNFQFRLFFSEQVYKFYTKNKNLKLHRPNTYLNKLSNTIYVNI